VGGEEGEAKTSRSAAIRVGEFMTPVFAFRPPESTLSDERRLSGYQATFSEDRRTIAS